MNNFNFGRLFSFLAFLAFAAVSCWATAESLYLSLDLDITVCYVISIGFFIVASIGTALIVRGLNPNTSFENPGFAVWGGIFMVIAFWLLCSMPTNTHTFVYRDKVKKVVIEDVSTTINYLEKLRTNALQEKVINQAILNQRAKIESKKDNLYREIRDTRNPGYGPYAKSIVSDISNDLGQEIRVSSGFYGTLNQNMREDLISDLTSQINAALRLWEEHQRKLLLDGDTETFKQDAAQKIMPLRDLLYHVEYTPDSVDFYNRDFMSDCVHAPLKNGYTTIGNYCEFLQFKSEEEKELYKSNLTKVDKIQEVFVVWQDIFRGKYNGHGLWYWIVLSILVDIAAFIFFDIAFARED